MNITAVTVREMERRPKQDRNVLVRLDRAMVERVDSLAARERTTRSALVRRLLLDLLRRDEAERSEAKRAA